MPYHPLLAERIRTALTHWPDVTEKTMFRGRAFMVNEKLCLCVGPHDIMVRLAPADYEAAVTTGGATPMVVNGREYRGYVYVDERNLRSPEALQCWIDQALAYNPQAKSVRKRVRS